MIRKAFLIQAMPGMEIEYERRHNPIWPELKKVLKEHGINNYSIFLHKDSRNLFCYLEIEDEKKFLELSNVEICKRWWHFMKDVLVCENEQSIKAKEEELREVFYLP